MKHIVAVVFLCPVNIVFDSHMVVNWEIVVGDGGQRLQFYQVMDIEWNCSIADRGHENYRKLVTVKVFFFLLTTVFLLLFISGCLLAAG